MSQKSKLNRARREAKQEEEGKKVVKWLFVGLIVLALISAVWMMAVAYPLSPNHQDKHNCVGLK